MKIAMNKDEWCKMACQELKDNDVRSIDGILYSGNQAMEQINIVGTSMILFRLPDEKYHKWANDAMEKAELKSCHLSPMHVSKMYQYYSERMTEGCKKNIIEYLARVREEFIGDEMDFVGVNDNFPCAAVYASAMMAKLLKDETMLEEAYKRLRQAEALLKRRGVLSEYNSPTYTPFQLYILSGLEEIIPDERYRIIIRKLINRICVDFIAHFNPACGTFCGPHSRQYLEENPVEGLHLFIYDMFKPNCHIDVSNRRIALGESLWRCAEFECDNRIAAMINERKYPFEFKATAECSASNDATPEALESIDGTDDSDVYIYPAGEEKLYTYMTEYYSIGTATKEWHSGIQTASFNLTYRRGASKMAGDIRSVNCRYLLNDEEVEDQRFFEQGRKMAFGNKNRAMVLYKPKVAAPSAVHTMSGALAQHYRRQEVMGNKEVISAKLVLFFQLHSIMPDAIYIRNKKLDGFETERDVAESVYVKDGDVFWAIHPLAVTDLGRKNAMTIRIRDDKLEIAFYNYQGERRDFSKNEFLHTRNGFGFAVSSVSECGSFEDFIAKEEKTVISDRMITSMHSRKTYIRSVKMENDEMRLSAEISPASEGIKFIACNDYPIEIPKLYLSDFDINQLPYMKKEDE